MTVDKVVFVPAAIQTWMNNTSTKSSGVISLPTKLHKEVEEFFGKSITNEIPYRAMSFDDDVMAYFHKQKDFIRGVKNAENLAKENGWEIVDDYFLGNEQEFVLSEPME